eukprot:superscaffoldBa00000651_g6311
MRRAATWSPKPKGRAELILSLLSQDGMRGTLSESSSSISSPEHAAGSCSSRCAAGPCSPLSSGDSSELAGPTNLVTYLQINRILKEAHFQSLHSRGCLEPIKKYVLIKQPALTMHDYSRSLCCCRGTDKLRASCSHRTGCRGASRATPDTLHPEIQFKAQLLPLAAYYGGRPTANQRVEAP